jgi:hypothetical protein
MKRDSMIFYRSFYESLSGLDPIIKAEVYDAIFEYGLNFQEIEFINPTSKALFTLIKPQLDANIKKWNSGNQPKAKQNKSKTEAKTKHKISKVEANVNDNVNVNDNENIEDRKSKFYVSLSLYVNEYPKKMLREFYDYWTEHGVKDKKLRFEKEKTFGIEQRLRTWYNRNPKQYDQDNDPNPPEYYIAKAQGLC